MKAGSQNSHPFASGKDTGGGLLEQLRKDLACTYVSDLRSGYPNELARLRMAQIDLECYPLSELEDAASYLFSEKRHFADYRDASLFFLNLDQRKLSAEKERDKT